MIDFVIYGIISYLFGAALSWYLCKPLRAFQEGYNAAKDFYGNYDRGFNDGWKSAFTEIDKVLFAHPEEKGDKN